ncbi:MAG: fused MFS/spermidine synthase, partial [SAR324 cluster bacterium]|nr:fused MFS/spermidine synthase [SAR324 cluster bacterium]
LSGHLPFAFNASAQEVLVVGLASGVTAGSVATHPVKRITVVEIEPAVGEAAREFSAFNNNVLDDPRLELIYDDGRHFLAVTGRKFDLIISEPSNPWMSGPARLFTREFFTLARRKLRKDGVFAQWVPLYGLGPRYFRSLLKTFLDVFPEATAFRVAEGDLLLIGSDSPLQISLAGLERAFAAPSIREDLARIGADSPGALLAKWIGGKATLLAVAGEDAEINTDDNGLVEFGAPSFLNQPTLLENLSLLKQGRRPAELESILRLDSPNPKSAEILIDAAKAAIMDSNLEFAGEAAGILKMQNHLSAFHYVRGAILLAQGENESARSAWRMVRPGNSVFVTAMLKLAELELDSEPGADAADETLRQIPQAAGRNPFNFLRGRIALRRDEPDQALRAFRRITSDDADSMTLEVLLYSYLATARKGDREGSERFRQEIFNHTKRIRRAAERDQGQIVIDRLLAVFSQHKTRWLKPAERAQLEEWLRTLLLEPLSRYYRGVSLLWSGKEKQASAALRRAALALPAPDPGSMIHYFLALSIQNNEPAGALKLLRAFADARAAEQKDNDWLDGDLERLMAKLLSRLSSGR